MIVNLFYAGGRGSRIRGPGLKNLGAGAQESGAGANQRATGSYGFHPSIELCVTQDAPTDRGMVRKKCFVRFVAFFGGLFLAVYGQLACIHRCEA